LRWTTDAASVALGTFRIYVSDSDAPSGDPAWTILADDITPVEGVHHLYYSAPFDNTSRKFYYVTGICNNAR
jgi:hypothetical protein